MRYPIHHPDVAAKASSKGFASACPAKALRRPTSRESVGTEVDSQVMGTCPEGPMLLQKEWIPRLLCSHPRFPQWGDFLGTQGRLELWHRGKTVGSVVGQ